MEKPKIIIDLDEYNSLKEDRDVRRFLEENSHRVCCAIKFTESVPSGDKFVHNGVAYVNPSKLPKVIQGIKKAHEAEISEIKKEYQRLLSEKDSEIERLRNRKRFWLF